MSYYTGDQDGYQTYQGYPEQQYANQGYNLSYTAAGQDNLQQHYYQQYQGPSQHQTSYDGSCLQQQQQYSQQDSSDQGVTSSDPINRTTPLATNDTGLRWTWTSFPTSYRSKNSSSGAILSNISASVTGLVSGGAPSSNPGNNQGIAAATDGNNDRGHSLTLPDDTIIPLGALYTPLAARDAETQDPGSGPVCTSHFRPQICKQCGTFLTWVGTEISFSGRYWSCPSCLTRNALPPEIGAPTPASRNTPLPVDVATHPALIASSVEYGCHDETNPRTALPEARPTFILIVDLSIEETELEALQSQLRSFIESLPPHSVISLITFGRNVTVWDLGSEHVGRCFSIRGNKSFPIATHGLHAFADPSEATASLVSNITNTFSSAVGREAAPENTSSGGPATMFTTTPNAGDVINQDIEIQKQRRRANPSATAQLLVNEGGTSDSPSVAVAPRLPATASALHESSNVYLRTMLGITPEVPYVLGRFLMPLDQCEFILTSIIDELSPDPYPVPMGHRAERATGTALETAVILLEAFEVPHLSKVMLFTGGPTTRGDGAIVPLSKATMLRSHRDFLDGNVPLYEKALTFYRLLEHRLLQLGTGLDTFVASFDQVGIMELRNCVNNTGGVFICQDSFADPMFSNSLRRYCKIRDLPCSSSEDNNATTFDDALLRNTTGNPPGEPVRVAPAGCGYNVLLEVHTSRDTFVSGAIGPCNAIPLVASSNDSSATGGRLPFIYSYPCGSNLTPAERNTRLRECHTSVRHVSNNTVGESQTQRWTLSNIDPELCISFVFDTATLEPAETNGHVSQQTQQQSTTQQVRYRFIQFVTRFTTLKGDQRIRVTSVNHHISPATKVSATGTLVTDPMYLVTNNTFDQTAAATFISKMAVASLEDYNPLGWENAKRWLDRTLVRFVRRFGEYRVGAVDSLRLAPSLSLFPSFMYNLRRSEYFMVLNISPDETVFKRSWLMREACHCAVLMIQPTLFSYSLEAPQGIPVPLDSSSIHPDNILVIDAFFNVHIVWGVTVYEWRKQGYHEDPNYAYFKALLQAPEDDVAALLACRFPYPRFSRTDINGGESRHLKTRLNPSNTYASPQAAAAAAAGAKDGTIMNTDDASVAQFMQTLKQAVVQV